MRVVFVAAFLFVLQASGCMPSTIAPEYARYSGCPQDQIEVTELPSDNKYKASGCGASATFRCSDVHMDLCQSPMIVVAKRHAQQFSCSPKQAAVEHLGGDAYLARGCGQKMTYQCFADSEYAVRCVTESSEINLNR
jgi:hypothetical protein